MRLKDILDNGKNILKKNKIDNFQFDATEILLNILDMDMARFLFEYEDDLEKKYDKSTISELISEFNELINARASHFPLQYILGEAYFCGIKFEVNNDVLIPRQDTEILVEKVITDNQDKNKSVLDLCTGSGCIAISLASLGEYKLIIGTDISNDAIKIAANNAESIIKDNDFEDEMKQHIYFLQSDMFDGMEKIKSQLGVSTFDIITANPPYIKTDDINNMQSEVKDFEPIIALDGDKDGLKYYKIIANNAKQYLNPDGKIYLEIGYNQANDVKRIFENTGYNHVETLKDLGGKDRVIIFTI